MSIPITRVVLSLAAKMRSGRPATIAAPPTPSNFAKSRRLIRTSATARFMSNASCLDRPTLDECQVISDVFRRDLLLTLDTDLGRLLTGSLQGSWAVNDAKHLNRRTNQLILTVGFTLSLFAGDFR